jgi:hypothetical protein
LAGAYLAIDAIDAVYLLMFAAGGEANSYAGSDCCASAGARIAAFASARPSSNPETMKRVITSPSPWFGRKVFTQETAANYQRDQSPGNGRDCSLALRLTHPSA